jgi:hypothetical protein
LARAFRSLLLPAKAIALNVLSVAAACGVLVLVRQEGYASKLIWGIDATGSIASWNDADGLRLPVRSLDGLRAKRQRLHSEPRSPSG